VFFFGLTQFHYFNEIYFIGAERAQVEYFFEQSALSSKPVVSISKTILI
jgi:hypothetical protein